LVDSTLLAGRFMRQVPLGGTPSVTLHIAADIPVALHLSAEGQAHYRRLVRETTALFGATHYDHYEFLWALTEQIMPDGLEHHQSSDDRSPLRALIDDPIRRAEANLLAHEYVHSWNGKYRRPEGLATPNYQEPMIDVPSTGPRVVPYTDDQATIGDVIPGSPADAAGLAPGGHVTALNGYKWSKELVHDTLTAPPNPAGTLTLLIQKDDMHKTLEIHYSGGERYPNLVREPSAPDLLAQIARPHTAVTE
jgi:predicted metalloprotease with PDZ domain